MTRGRRLLLFLLSFGVLALVIVIYSSLSGGGWREEPSDIQAVNDPAVSTQSLKRIGPGQAMVDRGQELNIVTRGPGGKIQEQFHIDRFEFLTEDLMKMEGVRLAWHLKEGQTLTLTAATGEAHIERGSGGKVQLTDGQLEGKVHIMLRRKPRRNAAKLPPDVRRRQDILVTTDNMKFDARSCTLQTDEPVDLWGPDVEVHGTGMVLRWREITRQIDRLVINYGDRLIWWGVDDNAVAGLSSEPGNAKPIAKPAEQTPNVMDSDKIHSYMASFRGNVRVAYRVYQDREAYQDQILDSADYLNILFDLNSDDQFAEQNRKPGQKKPRELRTDRNRLELTWDGELIIVPSEPVPDVETGQKSFGIEAVGQPVEFTSAEFSGSCPKLQVGHETQTARLFGDENHDVHLKSSTGDTIDCDDQSSFNWNTGLGKFTGQGTLRSVRPRRSNEGRKREIGLTWRERARVLFTERPGADGSAEQGDLAKDFYLEDAVAVGDVRVTSDQVSARAGRLHVKLGPPGSDGTAEGQTIESLEAWDEFSSKLPHKDEELDVSSESMNATFSTRHSGVGQFLSQIDLRVSVQAILPASEAGQDKLTCDHLHVEMIESDDDQKSGSADGSLEEGYGNLTVSKLVATGNVIGSHEVQDESISGFTAEMMERIELPGQLDRSLWSQESSAPRYDKLTVLRGEKAKIYKGLDSLSSKVIVIIENEADDGERLLTLGTPGAGDMTATFESDEQGQPPATLENLHWSGWMMFGSKANRALFTGLVHNRVRGTVKHSPTRTSGLRTGKLELFLKPEPVTELDKTLASSRELISAEPFFEPMAQRKLDNMVLTGSSEVRSVEHPVGDPTTRLRSAWLKSDKLNYRTQAGLFTTGGPGTLLLEDYRETKTEVTADPPAAGVETGQPSDPPDTTVRKGQTAFIWKTSAKYDQEEQQAILTGDVYMNAMGYGVSLPTRTKGEKTNTPTQRRQTQLWCQKLTVRFADSHPDGGPEDTTAPPVADLSAMDEMKISQVRASKDVVLKSGGVEITADEMIYDPTSDPDKDPAQYDLEITGSRKILAELIYYDPQQGWLRLRGKTIRYNTLTMESHVIGGSTMHYGAKRP